MGLKGISGCPWWHFKGSYGVSGGFKGYARDDSRDFGGVPWGFSGKKFQGHFLGYSGVF